jgi:hypothetical protein
MAFTISCFRLRSLLQQDITDQSIYSIKQSKICTEEDRRLELAEEKKQGVRKKID